MSFDVFLQAFENGRPAGIPRERVRGAFGAAVAAGSTPDTWTLLYDRENSCDVRIGAGGTANLVQELSIHRPCGDARLWDSLASILALGNVVLYFPGCRVPLVATQGTSRHLPADLVESLGDPAVVSTGAEILDAIRAV
jgi:hypothetical protein